MRFSTTAFWAGPACKDGPVYGVLCDDAIHVRAIGEIQVRSLPHSKITSSVTETRMLSTSVETMAYFNAFGCMDIRNALTYRNLEQCRADGAIRFAYLGLWPWEEKS